ncbi:YraN family protein [Georgenia halophila]|uniref:YraN family protein n=1 Tax=Georgenia halophila TaxID=620889 RepID=UPI0031F11E09
MRAKDAVGRYGENVVAQQLAARGWEVLDRNWRCRHGELDIVAREPGGALVFVEVKTRRGTAYGHPAEAVTRAKLTRLRRLAAAWLAEHAGVHAETIRIDVVAVLVPRSGAAQLTHVEAVG